MFKLEILCEIFNMLVFYGRELIASRPTSKLEGHPLSAVRDCLFNIFADTSILGGLCSHSQPEDVPQCGKNKLA
jgi:hypothetical protein